MRFLMCWQRRHAEAEADLARAVRARDEVRERWPAVRAAAQTMHDLRERNHFGDQIRIIFRGGEQP